MNKIATFAMKTAAATALVGMGTYRVTKGAVVGGFYGALAGGAAELIKFSEEVRAGYQEAQEQKTAQARKDNEAHVAAGQTAQRV